MGRRWNETMPPAVRSRASASVTNRWCSANATSRAIMTVAFLGPARMTHAWPGGVWEPPAVPAAIRTAVSDARRRAGEGGGDGGERGLGRLAGIDGGDHLARGAGWRGRLGERGGRPADEQDDIVVVAVVPEPGEPRRVGRAQPGERRQARQDEHEQQRDERARPHASASGEGNTALTPLAGQSLDGMCQSWWPIVVD